MRGHGGRDICYQPEGEQGRVVIGGKAYRLMVLPVMAYGPGTATITVKTNDGSNKSISFQVTVEDW